MADEYQPCALVQSRLELADDGVVGILGVQRQHPHVGAVAMGDVPAWRQHRAVLQVAGDDLVAFLPVEAAEDDVQALGGVAGDQSLVHVGAQQAGGGGAGFLLDLAAALVDAGGGRPLLRLQGHPRLHCLGGAARWRPRPAGVHVGQVLEDRNLVAQLLYVHSGHSLALQLKMCPAALRRRVRRLASAAMRRSFQDSHAA